MSIIQKSLVERRVKYLTYIPEEWEYGRRQGYKLDLRMCQIQRLVYDFIWNDESIPVPDNSTIVHTPYKILVLDLSLNELKTISDENLAMMPQLRVLDLSLNRISRCTGIDVCKRLHHLNLSHNFIEKLEGLDHCRLLYELNASMNQLTDISSLPPLSNLSILRVNNNNLESLDGVQSLAHLRELYCHRNKIRDLLPLSGSLRLITINASDNQIDSLEVTVNVLGKLHRLKSLSLYGNPIDREYNYHSLIMESTSISGLDNVDIKPPPPKHADHDGPVHFTIKDATRQAFIDSLQDKRIKMQQNVEFLQSRIIEIQEEYKEFEDQVYRDMDSCMVYLDSLGPEQLEQYDVRALKQDKPWEQAPFIRLPEKDDQSPARKGHKKGDYSGVKNTDEVLRHAYNELAAEFPEHESTTHTPSW